MNFINITISNIKRAFFCLAVSCFSVFNIGLCAGNKTQQQPSDIELTEDILRKEIDELSNDDDQKASLLREGNVVLEEAIELCDDLKAQIGWWSSFWSKKVRKKTLFEKQMLQDIEKVKYDLVQLFADGNVGKEKKDLVVLAKKLKGIKKAVDLHKRLKQKAQKASKCRWFVGISGSVLYYITGLTQHNQSSH